MSLLEGFIIFIIGIFILYQGVAKIYHAQEVENLQDSFGAMIFSLCVTIFWYFFAISGKTPLCYFLRARNYTQMALDLGFLA